MHKKFKSLFMLDPGIIYLNHGSYGACPRPVFDTLVKYQKQLEFEPVKHFTYDIYQYLEKSRKSLSDYLNCHMDDVIFFPNPYSNIFFVRIRFNFIFIKYIYNAFFNFVN